MHVGLRFELHCGIDDAWDAIRSPAVMQEVAWPLATFRSLEPGGFPVRWTPGEHPVAVRAMFGLLHAGRQTIDISTREPGGTRIVEDSGGPIDGPINSITEWRHRMAVTPIAGGRTLFRDRLEFATRLPDPIAWIGMWSFWQWRGVGIRRVAARRGRS